MRSYGEYCPVAKGAEVLGDRWTLLIVREMLHGVHRFNELERCLPGISRSVMAQRLRHLARVGLVVRRSDASGGVSYSLTQAGSELRPVVQTLGDWAAKWVFGDPDPSELDPDLVVNWVSRHLARDRLPPRRVSVAFELSDRSTHRYWIVVDADDASVCRDDPGFPVDAMFRCTVETLYRIYLGQTTMNQARRGGRLELTGAPWIMRDIDKWFAWSTFAPAVQAGQRLRSSVEPSAEPAQSAP